MKAITNNQLSELAAGAELPRFTKPPVTREQLVQYAHASGDLNPLHTDDAFAKSIGMDGVIAHGMLVMAFLGGYVQDLAAADARIHRFSMRFGAMTRPGDAITCGGTLKEWTEVDGLPAAALDLFAEKAPGERVGTGSAVLVFENPND